MALMRSKVIPEGAVAIDETEATTYAWNIISDWRSVSDTWALRYGSVILGGISAVSGILINKHYRFKLKLGTYGYMSSVIPISLMPGLLTALFHRHLVSTEMLLMKREGCPLCYEMRSAAIQLTLGIAYPMVLGPASALMFASRYCTYRVPGLVEGPRVMFGFLKKISRPLSGTLAFLTATHFVASSAITYFEMRNHISVRTQIAEIENKLMLAEEAKSKNRQDHDNIMSSEN